MDDLPEMRPDLESVRRDFDFLRFDEQVPRELLFECFDEADWDRAQWALHKVQWALIMNTDPEAQISYRVLATGLPLVLTQEATATVGKLEKAVAILAEAMDSEVGRLLVRALVDSRTDTTLQATLEDLTEDLGSVRNRLARPADAVDLTARAAAFWLSEIYDNLIDHAHHSQDAHHDFCRRGLYVLRARDGVVTRRQVFTLISDSREAGAFRLKVTSTGSAHALAGDPAARQGLVMALCAGRNPFRDD